MSRWKMWWLAGIAALVSLAGTAAARDFVMAVDGETVYFDLDRTRVAVEFSASTAAGEQASLLASFPAVESPAVERYEAPLHMTVVRLKPDLSESVVLSTLAALEASPTVVWAAPVLRYDKLEHVPTSRLYIQFGWDVRESAIRSLLDKYGLTLLKRCDEWADNVVYVSRGKGTGVESMDIAWALSHEPGVEWANPDFNRTVRLATNDTYYSSQWYLNQGSDHDIDAPEAWAYTTGSSSIVISICDVGVQIAHPDLAGHVNTGYDAVDGDSDPTPATTYSDDGHGTCCAGIAAAVTNNSMGVAGVGYNCHLVGTRMGYIIFGLFIQTNDTWQINCINYSRDHAHVMSNSWGGGSPSSAVNTAFQNARNAGLTILAASGNDGGAISWPATLSYIIAVGSTGTNDYRMSYSDYGSQLDVVAPGDQQYTTDDSRDGAGYSSGAYYSDFGGTSGACPVAAGVCALVLSVDSTLTPTQVQTILQSNADDLVGDPSEDVAGWDQYMGWGRVNANRAVHAVQNIHVSAPDGGETWYTGTTQSITWTSSGVSGNVNIELNRTYPSGGWESLFSGTANDGSQPWPVSGTNTTQARVRVISVGTPTVGDTSDANFTIGTRAITVVSPNGGENWTVTQTHDITWTSQYITGNVSIQLNRSYPGPSWENIISNTTNSGTYPWPVTSPASTTARVRVVSIDFPAVGDTSNGNFTIIVPNLPPVMSHNMLADVPLGSGTVTALVNDPIFIQSIVAVRMHYRLVGAVNFDSLALTPTGNPTEYAASLAALGAGSYQYFLRATDDGGLRVTVPSNAPDSLFSFDVGLFCGTEMVYDDGSAEWFNHSNDLLGINIQWAAKFGPVQTPYVLCAARFAASRSIPDTLHTPVRVLVYLADGPGGLPGTVMRDMITGSVGNRIGGLPAGTNWAQVLINDGAGGPLVLNQSQFYVAVANYRAGNYEAFGRDSNGARNHRSYFWDACQSIWYSEDDSTLSTNAHPGNRLIRAQGYSLSNPTVVISCSGNLILLNWSRTGAPVYHVYNATTPTGTYNFMQATPDTFLTVSRVDTASVKLFYQVLSSTN